MDLEPSANPEVTNFVWYKNEDLLSTSPSSSNLFDERVTTQKSVLRIRPVRIEDMANYTLLATNSLGTARFRFFLNVTCKSEWSASRDGVMKAVVCWLIVLIS